MRELEAVVLKNKMEKTVVVQTKRLQQNSQFKTYRYIYTKYKAHDENNECNIGDKVLIRESRPLSKEKRWTVVKVLERGVA